MTSEATTGRVVMTRPAGFGFISTERGNVYFRTEGTDAVRGDKVRFSISQVNGRPRAVNVRLFDPAVAAEVARALG